MLSLLLQLCLAALAFAAPTANEIHATSSNAWQYGTGGGVLGFIVLIIDVLVWMEVLKSNRPPLPKIGWSLLVFLFPIGGAIIYWLFANRAAHNQGAGYEPIGGA
ncbi:hypothetical protein CLAFUW4_05215 [Fulvia fulva]|uniref:Cardiolipin synthase N-terminal domain-containing protein n=1 Tax=Passalora fulva TaxID=5499 RepID=A0A9Q8PIE4_PASFU|nr:uncharacterized protein CLAFUR5_11691 [Fulvia fulva]KAK4626947.1 hypothetical protein CLAFUR4_05201 [Fulvia fulva]KAK4628594.1 hypothetical protein CLAFUR0_05207 [Fulvia fulva]UJO23219.1 hypothetical protein CLAFUR5_11691 [Fulvia fulva]WPV13930.1 hypothetical protein CLAFUW4_05215 [Fulvia fulva]WPV28600.1 hypothetical protein CLAFUW7_05211 [Fulvia fulva]